MSSKQKKQHMLFASNLRKYYEKWKMKDRSNTQEKLAYLVGKADRKSISNYLNAVNYPDEDTLNALCDILDTTPEELNGLDDFRTRYQYKEDTAERIRNGYDAFCSGIGLSNDFLKFIRSALPDESFPLFTEIIKDFDHCYRDTPHETAETKTGSEYQIYTAAGEHTDLTYPDYAFLKDVQDQVTELVEYLYFKRQKQLDAALKTINDECFVGNVEYGIRKERLCETDPYYRYTLGDQGKIIESEIEKRKQ